MFGPSPNPEVLDVRTEHLPRLHLPPALHRGDRSLPTPRHDRVEFLHNIMEYEFNGKVFPVNPRAEVIHSMKVYDTVLQIYDEIDLAIIVVPKQYVPQALEDCGRKGIKGVVVISAGFREVGEEGVHREEELIAIRPKPPQTRQLLLTYAQARLVGYASWVLLPAAVLAAGAYVSWQRR